MITGKKYSAECMDITTGRVQENMGLSSLSLLERHEMISSGLCAFRWHGTMEGLKYWSLVDMRLHDYAYQLEIQYYNSDRHGEHEWNCR